MHKHTLYHFDAFKGFALIFMHLICDDVILVKVNTLPCVMIKDSMNRQVPFQLISLSIWAF